jgi:hypothetical protein
MDGMILLTVNGAFDAKFSLFLRLVILRVPRYYSIG